MVIFDCHLCVFVFFCFKQKTAYEVRIRDWSSDVCSSDLHRDLVAHYRDCLIKEGATNVIGIDEIWEQIPRWVMYGIQAWAANMDSWGQNGMPMNERTFTAGEDLGTWKLLLGE